MSAPHKHAAIVKAWADGVKVEYRLDTEPDTWHPLRALGGNGSSPGFHDYCEYRIAAPAPMPPHFPPGTRVWCYPGTENGYEGVVERFRPNIFNSTRYVYDIVGHLSAPASHVVEFDENHNQKRALAQGKLIECRSKNPNDRTKASPTNPEGWYVLTHPQWLSDCEYRIKSVVETTRCACSPIRIGLDAKASDPKMYVHLDATKTDGVITDVKLAKWEVK